MSLVDENTLTNIWAVTDVAEVRWRRYTARNGADLSSIFHERGDLRDPFFGALFDLRRAGALCSWRADASSERSLWVWDLAGATEQQQPPSVPADLDLADSGAISDPAHPFIALFKRALADRLVGLLEKMGAVQLGNRCLFPSHRPDASGMLALELLPHWTGQTVLVSAAVHVVPLRRFDAMNDLPGQQVLVAPYGERATFAQVFGPCEPTLLSSWARICALQSPPSPPSAVVCTLRGQSLLFPSHALFVAESVKSDARPNAPMAMWDLLLRDLQLAFQPNGSILSNAAKDALVMDRSSVDYWSYVEPVHTFEDNSASMPAPAGFPPVSTTSLFDISRVTSAGATSALLSNDWGADYDDTQAADMNIDNILDFFEDNDSRGTGGAATGSGAATSVDTQRTNDYSFNSLSRLAASPLPVFSADPTASLGTPAALTPTLFNAPSTASPFPADAPAMPLFTPDGALVTPSPATLDGERLALLTSNEQFSSKYSYVPLAGLPADPTYKPDRLLVPTGSASRRRRGGGVANRPSPSIITPESLGGTPQSEGERVVPLVVGDVSEEGESGSESESESEGSESDDDSEVSDSDDGMTGIEVSNMPTPRYSPVAAASLTLWNSSVLNLSDRVADAPVTILDANDATDEAALRMFVQQAASQPRVLSAPMKNEEGDATRTFAPPRASARVLLRLNRLLASWLPAMLGNTGERSVRGPLSLQQLSEITDAEVNVLGYDVKLKFAKKRRLGERPAFETLDPPHVIVGQDTDWLQASAGVLEKWSSLGVGPYSPPKDIFAVLVCPPGADLLSHARALVRDIGSSYLAHRLGTQLLLEDDNLPSACLEVTLAATRAADAADIIESQLAAYAAALMRLGSILASVLPQLLEKRRASGVVVYLVDPFGDAKCTFRLCQAFAAGVAQIERAVLRASVVPQLLPAQCVLSPALYSASAADLAAETAFAVYNRVRPVHVAHNMKPTRPPPPAALYAPAYVLAPPRPSALSLSFPSSVRFFAAERVLHVAYALTADSRWVTCCCTDEAGELLEVDAVPIAAPADTAALAASFERIINVVKAVTRATSFPWRVVITRYGELTSTEMDAWSAVLGGILAVMTRLRENTASADSPNDATPLAGDTFNINSVSLVSVAAADNVQLFASKVASASSVRLVTTHRASIRGACAAASGSMIIDANAHSDWPAVSEVSLWWHYFASESLSSNLSYASWSAPNTPPWGVLSDIARQFHALAYVPSPRAGSEAGVPVHIGAVRRICRALSASL